MAQNILVTFKFIDSVAFGFNKYANIILITQIKNNKLIRKSDKKPFFYDIKHLTNFLLHKNKVKTYK
jgi:hypothetical protein